MELPVKIRQLSVQNNSTSYPLRSRTKIPFLGKLRLAMLGYNPLALPDGYHPLAMSKLDRNGFLAWLPSVSGPANCIQFYSIALGPKRVEYVRMDLDYCRKNLKPHSMQTPDTGVWVSDDVQLACNCIGLRHDYKWTRAQCLV